MSSVPDYVSNQASEIEIARFLTHCDASFVPPLSGRVDIANYARKLASRATRFEAWSGGSLVGLVAAYCSYPESPVGYITSVSVLPGWTGMGVGTRLMRLCIDFAKHAGMHQISLEVAAANVDAIRLYESCGFTAGEQTSAVVNMHLFLKEGPHEQEIR